MGAWTLSYKGDTRTLAAWGMTGAVISEQGLSTGMFTSQIPGDALAALPWIYEDQITLALDGVTKFVGVVLSPQRSSSGLSEMITLRFADPWYWMGQGTSTQSHWRGVSALPLPAIALFARFTPGVTFTRCTIGETIADIVAQCNDYFGGAVMQLGTLSGDGFAIKPVPQRLFNVTYESALRQAMEWIPDAVHRWDHTTTPPTLHIAQRSAATARSYKFADSVVMMAQEITPRDDLVVEGIQVTYHGIDIYGSAVIVQDHAGATTGTRILKAIIDCGGTALNGTPPTPTVTPAVTRDYTVDSGLLLPSDPYFWLEYGDTGAAEVADIEVGVATDVEPQFAPHAPENAGHSDLGGCYLQWYGGGIPASRVFANTRIALVTGYLTISTYVTETGTPPIVTTEVKERRIVKLLVPVTKLFGDYTQVISEQSVSVPDSVANAIPTLVTPGVAGAGGAAGGGGAAIRWPYNHHPSGV
jgi:hypothetical protein